MQREAVRPDGLRRLLGCVARSIGGRAALLDEAGQLLHAIPDMRPDLLTAVSDPVDRVHTGQAQAVTAEHGTQMFVVQSISRRQPAPVLVATGEKSAVLQAKELLSDAARLVWLCWQVHEADRVWERIDQADAQTRESVLHLLMLGDCGGAERVAAALGPRLADPLRVFVVEHAPETVARDALVAQCAEICDGRAWVVRCPVYTRHVIVLAPADGGAGPVRAGDCPRQIEVEPVEKRFRMLVRRQNLRVGASHVVSLRETAAGYEQAFHALAAARSGAEQYAQFNPGNELAPLLGEAGRTWARQILAPLLDYVPDRSHDPDARELETTLTAWLNFHNGAARQLKIHRNTLSARLRRIEGLLDRDVRDIREQSTLHLALRVVRCPRLVVSETRHDDVEALFRTAVVRHWAQRQLAPLLTDEARLSLTTLRVWLANNARVDAAAATLGISVAGTRKRLLRLEEVLERSLLNGPSARYDLWLALRIHDGLGL